MFDVVIAGAGPTGLMLACELGLMGVRAVVLEKLARPTGLSKALGVQARTMEMLDHRGLLDEFAVGHRSPPFANFAAFQLDLRSFPFPHPYGLLIPQAEVERRLERRALDLGAEIRRGYEVVGLEQHDHAVEIRVAGPTGELRMEARYLVGCDGGHSNVRKLVGIDFPGLAPSVIARFGDVEMAPDGWPLLKQAVPELRERDFGIARTATGNFAILPLGQGVLRIAAVEWDAPDIDRSAPMELEELQAALARVIGTVLPLHHPRWLTRAQDNSRQAERYRERRVLLAGDAAHVHFAYGGMGMQTGLQDAGNLGWKLAAEAQGWAPPGLLDSYDSERQPVGQRVLMATRAATALARPGGHVTALRGLVAELLKQPETSRTVAEMLTSVDVHYDVAEGMVQHPLEGRWAPDLPLTMVDGSRTRVAERMRRGRGVLVDLTADASFASTARPWSSRVEIESARSEAPGSPQAMLVRPDGYVAWAIARGEGQAVGAGRLERALRRWFGE